MDSHEKNMGKSIPFFWLRRKESEPETQCHAKKNNSACQASQILQNASQSPGPMAPHVRFFFLGGGVLCLFFPAVLDSLHQFLQFFLLDFYFSVF